MNKKLILIIVIVLFALAGGFFLFLENKDSDLPQQDEVAIEDRINIELAKIKSIIEEDIREGRNFNDNEKILSGVDTLKALGAIKIVSNFNFESQAYCFSLERDGMKLCMDNEGIKDVNVFYCNENNIACSIFLGGGKEDYYIDNDDFLFEEEEEEEEVFEEESGLTLEEEVIVKTTSISVYIDEEENKFVFIGDEEFGPYENVEIVNNEEEWAILIEYDDEFYVNLNGEISGPYLEKPTIEFYGNEVGFYYIKDNNYYINLNDRVYGPYDDLTEFDLNEE